MKSIVVNYKGARMQVRGGACQTLSGPRNFAAFVTDDLVHVYRDRGPGRSAEHVDTLTVKEAQA